MITLITGVPGAGKTLRAVHYVLKAVDEGRAVYADIDGLAVAGVEPAPDDWQDAPDGALVVYDEAQRRFPPDGTGRSSRRDIAALELHRHRGMDLIFVTQHPNLIHSHVRRLVGLHEHLMRAFGWGMAQIYRRDEIIRVDSPTQRKQCESETWKHPPKLFDYYKSASLHVEKKRLPKPLIGMAVFGVLLVGVLVYLAQGVDFLNLGGHAMAETVGGNGSQGVSTAPIAGTFAPGRSISGNIAPTYNGCITMGNRCQCWTEDGEPLDLEYSECLAISLAPVIMSLQPVGSGDGTAGTAEARSRPAAPSFIASTDAQPIRD